MPDDDATGEKDGEQNNRPRLGKRSWMVMVVGGIVGGVLIHVVIYPNTLKNLECSFSEDPFCGQIRMYSDIDVPCQYWIGRVATYCGDEGFRSNGPRPDDSPRCLQAWQDLNKCREHAPLPRF